jgi:hypothetical protein
VQGLAKDRQRGLIQPFIAIMQVARSLSMSRQHAAAALAELGTVLPQATQNGKIPLRQHVATMTPRIAPAGLLIVGRTPAIQSRAELRTGGLRIGDLRRKQNNAQYCERNPIRHLVLLDR